MYEKRGRKQEIVQEQLLVLRSPCSFATAGSWLTALEFLVVLLRHGIHYIRITGRTNYERPNYELALE